MKLSARYATEWYIKRSISADSLDYTQTFFKPVLAKSNGGSVNSLMYDSFDQQLRSFSSLIPSKDYLQFFILFFFSHPVNEDQPKTSHVAKLPGHHPIEKVFLTMYVYILVLSEKMSVFTYISSRNYKKAIEAQNSN